MKTYRETMDELRFTEQEKEAMVDRLLERGGSRRKGLNLVFRIYRVSVNFSDINFAIGNRFKRTRHSEELRRHAYHNICGDI